MADTAQAAEDPTGDLGAFASLIDSHTPGANDNDNAGAGTLIYQPTQTNGAAEVSGGATGGGETGGGPTVTIGETTIVGEEQQPATDVTHVATYMTGTLVAKLQRMIKDKPIAEVTAYVLEMADAGASDKLYQETKQAVHPVCFMVMRDGGGKFLHVIHSTAYYPGEMYVKDDPDEGLLTYVNDRNKLGDPPAAGLAPTVLKSNVTRKLPKDLARLESLRDGDGTDLWDGYSTLDPAAMEPEISMARAVPTFPHLTIYLLEKRRTPLQTWKWLKGFIANNSLDENDFKTYFNYLMMAACLDAQGKSKMSIALPLRLFTSEEVVKFSQM